MSDQSIPLADVLRQMGRAGHMAKQNQTNPTRFEAMNPLELRRTDIRYQRSLPTLASLNHGFDDSTPRSASKRVTKSSSERSNAMTQRASCPCRNASSPSVTPCRGNVRNSCPDSLGSTDGAQLLKKIQAIDFALYDVVLYLDSYPDSCEALDLYHRLVQQRKDLTNQYEASFGPLTITGNQSQTSWDWFNKPFPWEAEAN